MDPARATRRHALLAWALWPIAAFATGCRGDQSALDAAGPGASAAANLWWMMFGVSAAIYAVVLAALLVAVLARRAPETPAPQVIGAAADRRATAWVVAAGVIAPAVLVVVLFLLAVSSFGALGVPPRADLTIEVKGHLWWWEIRYPGQGHGESVSVANELHIPVGRPVRVLLVSPNVIHSFWVPSLHGKVDLIPGKVNVTWLQADRPGVYRGQCAEYCGLQHTRMALLVVAEAPDAFEAWLRRQRQPAAAPVDDVTRRGLVVFERTCSPCHTIRGTSASWSRPGPDLTHLATRRTLAAGTLPHTKETLAAWIADPQALKRGVAMPPASLVPDDLAALLRYLETLQ